jgi:hypothetical protein
MKVNLFGVLMASAVASLVGSAALAGGKASASSEPKACYRKHCGKSVKGHEGQCAGTKVEDITSKKACTHAGGAWTTEAAAAKYKKKS